MIKNMKLSWNNVSLRMKWFYSIACTILVVYAIVCVIIYAALYSLLAENEKSNATRTVDDLQGYFASQHLQVTVNELQQQTGLMKAILQQDQTVRLYQLNGTELLQINDYSSAPPLKASKERVIKEITVDQTNVLVVQDVIMIGPSALIIQLIHPLTSFQAMMNYFLTTMLIMGVGAIILSSVFSYVLAGRFMRPLEELRNSMQQVKLHGVGASTLQTDYSQKDELGDVLTIYNEMLVKLEETFTRQEQFVFDASHELRTPIQAIEGNLSLLKRWGKDDKDVLEESLDISLLEIARMKKLMEELLLLARQQQPGVIDAIDVVAVLRELITNYSQASITIQAQQEEMLCFISQEAFTQIARNFVENSIRYCKGEPKIHIQITYSKQHLCMSFSDNGIGIEDEHLPYIFDRFYKADDARIHVEGSTGLGLSIVKMLVQKYGGSIAVKSEIGKGTRFSLQFPRKM